MSKIHFLLSRINAKLWVLPAVMSACVVGWVWISYMAGTYLEPSFFSFIEVSRETLLNLFTILASTMLTVATFSVSAIANAYASVATTASPRANRIVMKDGNVRSTLGAFLATFIYAVVAITALSAFEFGPTGRFLLFLAFVVQVGWVLLSFLSWVDRVSRLGRIGDTISRVAEAGRVAFSNADLCGTLSANRRDPDEKVDGDAHILRSERFGYVQHIDLDVVQEIAEDHELEIRFGIRPGSLLTVGYPMAHVVSSNRTTGAGDPYDGEMDARLKAAVTVGGERSIETDPRFALILLSEIADRALSPGVNDPGTAITVLPHQIELFHEWTLRQKERGDLSPGHKCRYSQVWVPPIEADDLVLDAFGPTARDGAGMVEVVIRLLKALQSLTFMDHPELAQAAAKYSQVVLELAEGKLVARSEKEAARKVAGIVTVE